MHLVAGSFAGESTPTTGMTRKSPTMDQGVQTSGGLANNAGPGGGNTGMPRGQRGGGGGYQRMGHADGYSRGGQDGYVRGNQDGYVRGGQDGYVRGNQDGYVRRGQDGYMRGGNDDYVRGGHEGLGYSRGGADRRRYNYNQPQYNSYGRYQQNDMRGGRPPMRGQWLFLIST